MIVVVALSSSLDVAAIELEMKTPLNYNSELIMVGISNMVSGLTGGYTGSYIFSQTIFSLRAGIGERLAGFVLAAVQLTVIVTPFPILTYVPNFFYGSLLSMICIDLMYEWLWDFRTKATIAEYIIGLSTFGLINLLGVEYGIISGVFVYIFCRQIPNSTFSLSGCLKQSPLLPSPPSLSTSSSQSSFLLHHLDNKIIHQLIDNPNPIKNAKHAYNIPYSNIIDWNQKDEANMMQTQSQDMISVQIQVRI